jgi:hypothetical protein
MNEIWPGAFCLMYAARRRISSATSAWMRSLGAPAAEQIVEADVAHHA